MTAQTFIYKDYKNLHTFNMHLRLKINNILKKSISAAKTQSMFSFNCQKNSRNKRAFLFNEKV